MSIYDEVCKECGNPPLSKSGRSLTFVEDRATPNESPWMCSDPACFYANPRNANGDFTIPKDQWVEPVQD